MSEITLVANRNYDPEPAVRRLVLERADFMRLTVYEWTHDRLFHRSMHYGGEGDPLFRQTFDQLLPYLVCEETNATKYWGIPQTSSAGFRHLYYRLTPSLKQLLNEVGLLWGIWNWKGFYGLEDPIFYRRRIGQEERKMLASVISHEAIFRLWVTEAELQRLRQDPQVNLS